MSKMLPYDKVDMSYVVLDSESTCFIGKKKNKEAIFYSDIKKAYSSFSHSNGIVVANSSFHYCMNWEEIISLFVEVSPRYIIIGRFPTAINQSKPIYSVQTIHGCGQAHVVLIPIDALVKEMNKYNYTLHSNLPLNDASNYFDKEKRQKVGIIKNITLVFKRN